jgi:hypothetical protein
MHVGDYKNIFDNVLLVKKTPKLTRMQENPEKLSHPYI